MAGSETGAAERRVSEPTRHRRVEAVVERLALTARDIRRARDLPFGGRTRGPRQLEALFLIAHADGPLTPGRLAAMLDVTPGAVTQMLDILRADGLVEQHPHPDDARARSLRLSASANEEVAVYEAAVIDSVAPAFHDLDDDELDTLLGLLTRIRSGASESPARIVPQT